MSSASTRLYASATPTVSAGNTANAPVMRETASSTEIIATPSSVVFASEHRIHTDPSGLRQLLGRHRRQVSRPAGEESVELVHRYGSLLGPLGRAQPPMQHECA